MSPSQSTELRFAGAVSRWLVRWRIPLALLGLLLGLFGVERSRQLEYSRSITAMFDRNDPAIVPFRRLGRTFGSSAAVLAVYDDAALFSPAGFDRLSSLTERLAAVPGIGSATSLATTPLGRSIIATNTNPAAARLVRLMEGYTVGSDRRTAAVVCVLAGGAEADDGVPGRGDTIDALREIMQEYPSGTVAGETVMLRDGFAMLRRDGNLLGTTAGLLASVVLLLLFRSLRWLVAPLAVVLLALWTTRGLLALAGQKLTMVSTMLSAMVTVVAIATVVHIIVEFRRRRTAGEPAEEALTGGLTQLFWPIIGAIITDMIGFGSLIASQVGPVHDFGIMTAIGAGMVLLAVALAVPWFALAGRLGGDPGRVWGEGKLDGGLDRLVEQIVRSPGPILAAAAALIALAAAGLTKLEVQTDFIKNFRADSPVVESYEIVESRLGGAGVWDILLPTTEPITANTLARVAALETRLRTEVAATGSAPGSGLTKVLSIADLLETVSPISLATLENSAVGSWMVEAAVGLLRQQQPQLAASLVGRDPADGSTWLRVMLRARERQPAAAKRQIIDQVRKLVTQHFPPTDSLPAGAVTGFFVLLAQLVERMLADQWLTFLLAAGGIFLLLSAGFRSPIIGAIALVPNTLPIVVVLGLLGWSGSPINMGTAMIAAVSLGLSVDSSIHYTTAFRRRLAHDGAIRAALETAHQTAGRAMIFSTLALVVGFLALTTSGFMPTVSFGGLSCLTLLGGLVGNLVVLPVLLSLAARRLHQGG
jgi:predicted RND superfamily exporter protein